MFSSINKTSTINNNYNTVGKAERYSCIHYSFTIKDTTILEIVKNKKDPRPILGWYLIDFRGLQL